MKTVLVMIETDDAPGVLEGLRELRDRRNPAMYRLAATEVGECDSLCKASGRLLEERTEL